MDKDIRKGLLEARNMVLEVTSCYEFSRMDLNIRIMADVITQLLDVLRDMMVQEEKVNQIKKKEVDQEILNVSKDIFLALTIFSNRVWENDNFLNNAIPETTRSLGGAILQLLRIFHKMFRKDQGWPKYDHPYYTGEVTIKM